MPEYYILSLREVDRSPAQCCVIEFEDVLVQSLDGKLITLKSAQSGFKGNYFVPFRKQVKAYDATDIPKKETTQDQILMVVVMQIGQAASLLKSISNWRSRFDQVNVYVFDSIVSESVRNTPSWRWKLSSTYRTLSSIDHLFVSMSGDRDTFEQLYNIPVSVLPAACDVIKFGSGNIERSIDVNGYGRQKKEDAQQLATAFNDPQSSRIYHHTDHMSISAINDFYAHRRLFWKLLTRSAIALAYDPFAVLGSRTIKIPFSFIPARWAESLTAGCLIVGKKPNCPEAEELLFWEDATVEMPEETEEVIPFIESLLEDKERLQAAHRRNYAYALAYYDWRIRIASMLDGLSLSYPDSLKVELEKLDQQKNLARLT